MLKHSIFPFQIAREVIFKYDSLFADTLRLCLFSGKFYSGITFHQTNRIDNKSCFQR
jgi:hypothetical protein